MIPVPALLLGLVIGASQQESPARRLTEGPATNRCPSWSRDGERLAFESNRAGNWDVFVLELESGAAEPLCATAANERYPAWAPDQDRLVFVGEGDEEADLFVVEVSSGEAQRVAALAGDEAFPAWSADGREIVYSRQLGGSIEVWSVALGSSEPRSLLRAPARDVWPRWSSDGERLVFFSRRAPHEEDDELYLVETAPDSSSSAMRRLTNRVGHDFCPAWSPTGERLVVVSIEPDGSRSLRILDLEGREVTRLAADYRRVTEPAWSPDGEHLAYAAAPGEGDTYQLYVQPVPDAR